MKHYSHITGAIVSYLLFAYITGSNQLLTGLLFASMSSVYPDILDMIIGKHKSYGHSIFLVVPCLFVGFFNVTIAIALTIGIISHTVLDMMTTNGTPILTPLWNEDFVILNKRRRIKTGTNQDKSAFITLLFILIILLVYNLGSINFYGTSLRSVFGFDDLNPEKMSNINEDTRRINSDFNINLKVDNDVNKIIIQKKDNENQTTILVSNAEPS